MPGDTPLLLPETLDELVATHVANGSAATLLTSVVDDPTGYGRVVTGQRRPGRCASSSSATPRPTSAAINEIATSIYAFRRDLLGPALRSITPDNAQGELYLTDVIGVLAGMGHRVGRVQAPGEETQGVNDRWQLALAERELRDRTNRHWLLNGVTMLDPRQTFIDVTVKLGRDVTLYPGTILRGQHGRRRRQRDRPDTRLDDCVVGRNCRVQHTVGVESRDRRRRPGRAVLPPAGRFARRQGDDDRCVLHCTRRTSDGSRRTLMEKVTTKKLALYSGRTHPELADEVAGHLGIELGHPNIVEFANGEVRPRFGESVRGNDVFILQTPLRHRRALHQRLDHGAADHDRRRLPGVGQADHRRLPVLRLRPPGPQGRGPRADHRPPRRRHVQGRRRQADDLDRPPRRPDPGLLRRPGRPPHGDAGARGVPARALPRRR